MSQSSQSQSYPCDRSSQTADHTKQEQIPEEAGNLADRHFKYCEDWRVRIRQ